MSKLLVKHLVERLSLVKTDIKVEDLSLKTWSFTTFFNVIGLDYDSSFYLFYFYKISLS